jgi:hypothetical protein
MCFARLCFGARVLGELLSRSMYLFHMPRRDYGLNKITLHY